MPTVSRLQFVSPMDDANTDALSLFAESLDTPLRLRLDFNNWLCEILWKGDPLKTTQMAATWHPLLPLRFLQNEARDWEKFLQDQGVIGVPVYEQLPRCPLRECSAFFMHSHGPCTLRLHCIQLDSGTFTTNFYQATREVDANTLILYNYEHLGYDGSHNFQDGLLRVLSLCTRRYGARRNLSIVCCRLPSFLNVVHGTWFLKRLRGQSQMMERFRFEKVSGVSFDSDGDGNLDDGSRLPEMVQNFGMREALRRTIEAYRVRKDLDCANLTIECHCTEEQMWSDGFDR
ncbi:hypothetical protein IWX90DRAFT_419085 [Phyllosticta citrichinensis]|uniref:Uncharacterized protein n=1 Tax=Phyllosticta citrichinensis TaxID=1130410 RepID=A0ABR1XG52_9PEZI